MHPSTTFLPGLAVAALSCAALSAQAPTSAASPVPVTATSALGTGHGLRIDGQDLLGCGSDYLVRFDRAGAHFTPVLGHEAPPVAPLQIGLLSIHHGGLPLPCDLADAPAMAGDVAVYDRSPTIRERYQLSPRGVEQSFVFDTLPGRGDLVVRCRLDGLGRLAVPAADGGVDFVRDGQRLVHMGTVTGIDARGARARGDIRLDGDVVELSLPASFVDHAALPLVLDPFLGNTAQITTTTAHDSAPHVVWHPVAQQWLCVYERRVSNAQTDVMLSTYGNGAAGPVMQVVASVAGAFTRLPRIAYHTGIDRCIVVYQQGTSEFAMYSIEGAVVDGLGTGITPFQVASNAAGSCAAPDLSGDPTGTGQGVIAYELRGAGLRMYPYTLGTTAAPTLGAQVVLSFNGSALRPRIAKSAGATIAIAYNQLPNNYNFGYLRAVSRAGALLGNPVAIGNLGGPDLLNPDIDGDGTDFLMAIEYQRGPGDRDVSIAQWRWNGSSWGSMVASAAVGQLLGVDERQPTVALLGSKYAVAWEQSSGFLTSVVKARNYSRDGCLTCGTEVAMPVVGSLGQPALASSRAGGGTDGRAMLLVTSMTTVFPPAGDITGFLWGTHRQSLPTVLATGCGLPTGFDLRGEPGIGNANFGLTITTSDPQAVLGAFLLGIGESTPLVPCGVCLTVAPVATSLAVLSGSTASYSFPLPCNPNLIGFEIQAQGAVVGSSMNVCPALHTLSMSRVLAFRVTE